MYFTMSFDEWQQQYPGLTREAALEKWRAEGQELYQRIKSRPSRAEEEFASLPDEPTDRRARWGARA